MIDKFSTQFIRIFSRPTPLPPIVGVTEDDLSPVFDAISERELDRRARYYQACHERALAVHEAHARWQAAVDEAHRLRLEYIDALGWMDPDFVARHRDAIEKGNAR